MTNIRKLIIKSIALPAICTVGAIVALSLGHLSIASGAFAFAIGQLAAEVVVLTKTLQKVLIDSDFAFVPAVAREVNGEISSTGLDQPEQTICGTEAEAHLLAIKFLRDHYPNRPDIRPAKLTVTLDELMLKPVPNDD